MSVEVVYTDEFGEWFDSLDDGDAESVLRVVDILELEGIALGSPHSSEIKGTALPFRELRPKGGRSPIRIYYAFDPRRQAVLLIGGSKSSNPDRFYRKTTKVAAKIWHQYLEEQELGMHDDPPKRTKKE